MSLASSSPASREVITVREYLLLSMVAGVFMFQPIARTGLDFYLGYVVILFNTGFLLWNRRLVVHTYHLGYLILLSLISIAAATVTGYGYLGTFRQMIGISLLSVYYFSVLYELALPVRKVMEVYTRFAVAVAIIGIAGYFYDIGFGRTFAFSDGRLVGVLPEPSLFVVATLPALSYAIFSWVQNRTLGSSALVLIAAYVFADSTLGYLGIIATLFLLLTRRSVLAWVLAPVVCAGLFAGMYAASENLRLRVDETINAELISAAEAQARQFAGDEDAVNSVENKNASTVALLTNGYVAYQAFFRSPLIGAGLGNHPALYDRYIGAILSPDYFLYGLNKLDANSMLLRAVSELGAFGLASVVFFLVYFGRVRGEMAILVRNCLLPYFAVKLLRMGHYFPLEFEFFVMMYVFNFLQDRVQVQRNERPSGVA